MAARTGKDFVLRVRVRMDKECSKTEIKNLVTAVLNDSGDMTREQIKLFKFWIEGRATHVEFQ